MTDDPFLTLGGRELENPSLSIPSKNKIIERTMLTMHKIRIYPNGQVFIVSGSVKSWFDKKGTVVKKRIKKVAKVKEVKLSKEEVY